MLKKYLIWIGNSAFVFLMVFMIVLVYFSVSSKLSPDGNSKLGSYQLMVVLSGSMSPAFDAGDVIVVSTGKNVKYNKGDIITFKDPEDDKRIITHRIKEVVKDGKEVSYRTKGDANNVEDQKLVTPSNVIGQEKWYIPYFGRLVEFSKTRQGLIWLIVLPGLFIIISELRSLSKAIYAEVEQKKQGA